MRVKVTSETTGGLGYVRLNDAEGRPTQVGVPLSWSVAFETVEDDDPYPGVSGGIAVAVEAGRPTVGALTLTVASPDEVTSDLLRWVSVPWLLSTGQLAVSVAVIGPGDGFAIVAPGELEEARQLAAGGKRVRLASLLPDVARVYLAHPEAPTRAVAEHFTKPHKTAQRWVSRARSEGLLPPTDAAPAAQPPRSTAGQAFGDGAVVEVAIQHTYGSASMSIDEAREFFDRANRDEKGRS